MIERIVEAAGSPLTRIVSGNGPVVAVALHAGHAMRPGLEPHFALSDSARKREEDPYTALMAPNGIPLIEVLRSRFEVDLNRARFRCVYQGPADAWGLSLYHDELPDDQDRISRAVYDTFYATAFDVLSRIADEHGSFVVLDLHSYNHRREGAGAPAADEHDNPEINLGTRRVDRDRWGGVIASFSAAMGEAGFDCRENVKFGGGHFAHWVADTFPDTGTALAIEFKKTYMDEWTGEVDASAIDRIRAGLDTAVNAVTRAPEMMRKN